MARRGSNRFRKNDAIRAIRSARDAGIEPAGLEVIIEASGTTTFRVLGDKLAPETPESAGVKAWNAETEKLKAKARRKEP
jgi:hypothetical protein